MKMIHVRARSLLALLALLGLAAPAAAQQDNQAQYTTEEELMEQEEQEPVEEGAEEMQGTESDVELTVGELQELLNLPPDAAMKEYQEDLEDPPSLFNEEDRETIERIFGERPRFIYFPEGVDPMIIPWVRAQVVAEELFAEATIAAANRDYDKALNFLRRIREELPETETASKVPAEMERVRNLREQAIAQAQGEEVPDEPERPEGPEEETEVVLPQWVKANTSAIMLSDIPTAIVGNDFLNVGEAVPRYPTVRVKTIAPSEVVYTYQNKDFSVEVDGSF